ncbi:MAG: PAS domain-containing sensor histidine kinase [Chloroflexota bacterium]
MKKLPEHNPLQPETLARLHQLAQEHNTTPDALLNQLLDAPPPPQPDPIPGLDLLPALDVVMDGCFIVDRQWHIVHFGGLAAKLWRVDADDAIGKTALDVFTGANKIPFQAHWEKAFAEQRPVSFTDYHPHLEMWMTFYGIPIKGYLLICYRDMDETIRRERMLLENEIRLQTITDNLPIIIYSTDSNGVFTYSAGKGLRGLGLKDGEAVGRSAYDLYGDYPVLIAKMERTLAGKEAGTSTQVEVMGRYFLLWDMPVWGKSGAVEGLLGVAIDLTEQREAEAIIAEKGRLEHDNRTLRQLNDMKTRFMNMVSHEFRTPLTIIQSSAELLQHYSDRLTDEKRHHHQHNITSQIAHLRTMLARMERGLETQANPPVPVRHPTDINNLLEAVLVQFREAYPERTYTLSVPEHLPIVDLDETLLAEALHSLLDNATQYSKPQTPITITVEYKEQLQISVKDEGMGIAEHELEHIFQPFFRTHAAETIAGTGIGLTIVRHVIEAHGGTVAAHSKPDRGTTVTLSIPHGHANENGACGLPEEEAGGE